jgi:hypothetical protein
LGIVRMMTSNDLDGHAPAREARRREGEAASAWPEAPARRSVSKASAADSL